MFLEVEKSKVKTLAGLWSSQGYSGLPVLHLMIRPLVGINAVSSCGTEEGTEGQKEKELFPSKRSIKIVHPMDEKGAVMA